MNPFVQVKSDGKLWRAGRTVYGLCAAWNHATNPRVMANDSEHARAQAYARAIHNRMRRHGYAHGVHYVELSTGSLWPKREVCMEGPCAGFLMPGEACETCGKVAV